MTSTLCGKPGDKAVVVGLPADFDLNEHLKAAQQVFLATAFATTTGWDIIKTALMESEAEINIIVGLYFCHTQPALLWEWFVEKRPKFNAFLAASSSATKQGTSVFHPKVLVVCGEQCRFAIVGSGNLTAGGLRSNVECSIYTEKVGEVNALLQWFKDVEKVSLSEAAILDYEPRYKKSAAARKALEEAQEEAERGIKSEIVFRKRADAIQAAQAHFQSPAYVNNASIRSRIIPTFRRLLDYETFNFDIPAWTEFYKKPWLGKIRESYLLSTVEHIATIREGLRFLFADEQGIEKRLPELMEGHRKFHVHGVGQNLISKFLAAHDPQQWFVFNKRVSTTLTAFGYEYSGTGNDTDSYLSFVDAMREFKKDCGAEDCVALDSFFSDWYDTHEAKRKAKLAD